MYNEHLSSHKYIVIMAIQIFCFTFFIHFVESSSTASNFDCFNCNSSFSNPLSWWTPGCESMEVVPWSSWRREMPCCGCMVANRLMWFLSCHCWVKGKAT